MRRRGERTNKKTYRHSPQSTSGGEQTVRGKRRLDGRDESEAQATHLEDAIEDQILQTEKERISPVPSAPKEPRVSDLSQTGFRSEDSRVVLDDPVSVDFDPEVEEDESQTSYPARNVEERRVVRRELEEGHGEKAVGEEVVEENDIDKVAEHDPDLHKRRHMSQVQPLRAKRCALR